MTIQNQRLDNTIELSRSTFGADGRLPNNEIRSEGRQTKSAYASPRLTIYGNVKTLVQAGTSGNTEGREHRSHRRKA
jgi:hypothetical protein